MVAVLPLAVLATFETVPGVPLAMARALAVRASAERLFALDEVPVPVARPRGTGHLGAGGARRSPSPTPRCATPTGCHGRSTGSRCACRPAGGWR